MGLPVCAIRPPLLLEEAPDPSSTDNDIIRPRRKAVSLAARFTVTSESTPSRRGPYANGGGPASGLSGMTHTLDGIHDGQGR